MGYGIRVETWGEYALFSRPEMKVERVSYEVMTPSAARGLIEAIYWKPALRWKIDKIHVFPFASPISAAMRWERQLSAFNVRSAMVKSVKPIYTHSLPFSSGPVLVLRDVRLRDRSPLRAHGQSRPGEKRRKSIGTLPCATCGRGNAFSPAMLWLPRIPQFIACWKRRK